MQCNKGWSVFLAVLMVSLAAAIAVGAQAHASPAAQQAVPATLSYQGHLLDTDGDPVADAAYTMTFSLWDAASGGNRLWGPETQSVQVTDGFFAAILGSTAPLDASALRPATYLEIALAGETLAPRQPLAAVAFALSSTMATTATYANTAGAVAWNTITGRPSTYPPGMHTHAGSDVTSAVPTATYATTAGAVAWSNVTGKPSTFTPGAHTHTGSDVTSAVASAAYAGSAPWSGLTGVPAGFADGVDDIVPAGVIVMWSGSASTIPGGWALCDGSNSTPDLRDRFIVGAGNSYGVGATGGEALHTLTTSEMPAHTHAIAGDGSHAHSIAGATWLDGSDGNVGVTAQGGRVADTDAAGWHNHGGGTGVTGGGAAHENRPPYYALAFIMKLP